MLIPKGVPFEGMGESHRAPARCQIGLVHSPYVLQVPLQGLHQALGQHGTPVLVSFAAAHRDAALL